MKILRVIISKGNIMDRYIEESTNINSEYIPKWYAVRTYPYKEKFAEINLVNQGFQVYLPLLYTLHRHARKEKYLKKPFFPGYLFIHLHHLHYWDKIGNTFGVKGLVVFDGYYPPVPDAIIEELRAREDKNGCISLKTVIEKGDKVRIMLPNNLMHTGIYKALHGKDRALILLDILNKQVAATVPLSNISQY